MTALYRLLIDPFVKSQAPMIPKMVLVAQQTSIGLPSLVNVPIEMEEIKAVVPPEHVTSLGDNQGVTVANVLNNLKDAHILHLACHGHQDQQDPLSSGFDLQDGRLTLGQLMRVKTPQAQLAYLSACDSAGMDESRPDEGLNLVGAMIFAGFKSVVGTMW
jgi:CHAT domain-containing protein